MILILGIFLVINKYSLQLDKRVVLPRFFGCELVQV